MSPQEDLELAQENGAQRLGVRFTGILNLQRHLPRPVSGLDEDSGEEGFGMDGSGRGGWAAIRESGMPLIPGPNTASMDRFAGTPTPAPLGEAKGPIAERRYDRDPRRIAPQAGLYLKYGGLAATVCSGTEGGFFVFGHRSRQRCTVSTPATASRRRAAYSARNRSRRSSAASGRSKPVPSACVPSHTSANRITASR